MKAFIEIDEAFANMSILHQKWGEEGRADLYSEYEKARARFERLAREHWPSISSEFWNRA